MTARPRHGRRRAVGRPRAAVAVGAVLLALAGCTSAPPPPDAGPPPGASPSSAAGEAPLRAFTPDSWWNTPVPPDAPAHPRAAEILDYMATAKEAGEGCVRLAGADDSLWGQPVYWSDPQDPEYRVRVDQPEVPPELDRLRIPRGARSADNSDGSMTLFDVDRGYTVALTDAVHDADTDTWSASGATVTYLDSNGLHELTGKASDERNTGSHRGNNGAVMMARFDEVEAGRIEHVLKVASGPEASRKFAFPMVGSDGDSRKPVAPVQGLRFRIKPSVDLGELDLHPQTLVIARALQEYGFYVGDSAGVTALKLEDTRTEGRGQLWEIPSTALCDLPLGTRFWDVLPEGYEPPA